MRTYEKRILPRPAIPQRPRVCPILFSLEISSISKDNFWFWSVNGADDGTVFAAALLQPVT